MLSLKDYSTPIETSTAMAHDNVQHELHSEGIISAVSYHTTFFRKWRLRFVQKTNTVPACSKQRITSYEIWKRFTWGYHEKKLLTMMTKLPIAVKQHVSIAGSFLGYNRKIIFSTDKNVIKTFLTRKHTWVSLLTASGVLSIWFDGICHGWKALSALRTRYIFLQYHITQFSS